MIHTPTPRPVTRREALCRMGAGFGMVGFGGVAGAQTAADPLLPKSPHFPAKARQGPRCSLPSSA